ncbi:tRNA pseudouridine(38-40) synthase TruA [bacterium]|nr:tRNA pseudouridine(38-40) synthase TruA [bacterium]
MEMRNIRLDVSYIGKNYFGWQWQPDAVTLEGAIKQAVEQMVRHEITLYSSGRTDAGVHAEQHVAHFFSQTQIQAENFLRGLNSLTPDDIVIRRVRDMPQQWSARHDPIEREYRYTFYNALIPNVFLQDYTCWEKRDLNVQAMREGARYLVGRHDFSAFRSLHCDADNPVRTLLECRIIDDRPLIHIHLRGHAFLRHQVRIMAGALRKVGMGWKEPASIKEALNSKVRDSTNETLPAHGLTLVAVRYAEDDEQDKQSDFLTRLYYQNAENPV